MKLTTILLCSLLFAAKDVYVEGATTVDSPGAVAVDPAAPVVCGRPNKCNEAAGLKAVNELHEVRLQRIHPIGACMSTLTVPRRCLWPHAGEVLLRLPHRTFQHLVQTRELLGMGKLPSQHCCRGLEPFYRGLQRRSDVYPGQGHLRRRRWKALHCCRARGRLHAGNGL